jgi:hypothetical protein
VEGEMSMPRIMKAGVPHGSVLSPTLFNMYINDTPQTIGVHDDTCLYSTEWKEGNVLRKLQRGLNSMAKWSKQAIYFSNRIRPPESLLTLNGQNTPFVNNVKYLDIIFDRKITWRPHIKTTETKASRAFIRTYSLFKSEHLSANIKLTL